MQKVLFPLAFVALISGGVYLMTGSPGHLTRFANEASAEGPDVGAQQISALRNQYAALFGVGPGTSDEWRALAAELSAQNSDHTPIAFMKAASVAETEAERILLLGAAAEQLVRLGEGRVSGRAKNIFENILVLDSNDPGALFYLGLEARQRSDRDATISFWSRFSAAAPKNHPLQEMVRNELRTNGIQHRQAEAQRAQFNEIAALPEEERRKQIKAMVAGLELRLRSDGGNSEEWRQLAQSYVQLEQMDEARWAFDQAIAASPENALILLERDQLFGGVR